MITINRKPIDFKNVFAIRSNNDTITIFNDDGVIDNIKWGNIDEQIDELDAIFEAMANCNVVTLAGTTFKADRIIAAGSNEVDGNEILQIYVRGIPDPISLEYTPEYTDKAEEIVELWDVAFKDSFHFNGVIVRSEEIVSVTGNGDNFSLELVDREIQREFNDFYGSKEDYNQSVSEFIQFSENRRKMMKALDDIEINKNKALTSSVK